MALITDGAVSPLSSPGITEQATPIIPVVQAQDGSFVGAVGTSPSPDDWPPQYNMIAFDETGSVRWTVANEMPQIATDDGGMIGQSGIAYDQNGNATRQVDAISGQYYSWTGNWYGISGTSTVQMTAYPALDLADSFTAFAGGNASGTRVANRPISRDVRQLIAQNALSHVNDPQPQHWLDTPGHNQCNIFVKDVLKEAGLNPPISPVDPSRGWRIKYLLGLVDTPGYPAQSRDWANPSTDLKCWRTVTDNVHAGPPALPPDISRPGDVIAEPINYSDTYGHVGIIVGPQQTVSADSASRCVFGTPAGTIDVTDYGFRPDNWVDPLGCGRMYGKKKDATVKRFVCQ